jgi:hypothetical protein
MDFSIDYTAAATDDAVSIHPASARLLRNPRFSSMDDVYAIQHALHNKPSGAWPIGLIQHSLAQSIAIMRRFS